MIAAVCLVWAAAVGQPPPLLPDVVPDPPAAVVDVPLAPEPAPAQSPPPNQPPTPSLPSVVVPGFDLSRPLNIIYQQPAAPAAAKPSLPAATQPAAEESPGQQAGTKTPSPNTLQPAEPAGAEQPASLLAEYSRDRPWFSVHGQATVVSQGNWKFPSPYIGPNSLLPNLNYRTTNTDTLYLDVRPWQGGEIVFNPEVSGGRGLSNTLGLAGFPNGEATRVGIVEPTPYVARMFYRHTFEFDGEWEKVEDAANTIPGPLARNRLQISIGKMSAEDVLDDNLYSHDPRTQFLNWAIMYTGAWDYPANARGYTYGALFDYTTMFFAVRYGIFAEPTVANGEQFDPHFLKAHGQLLEIQENFILGDHPLRVREWGYVNTAHMGKYRDALAEMPVDPDVTATRSYRNKYGFGLSLEKEITRELGFFLRAGWNDGQSESWAFTEIDDTAAMGFLLSGKAWRRPQDQVGLAYVINGLSDAHKDYLAAGGLGFILGDGQLSYAPEQILETYYNWEIHKNINLTFDWQGAVNPADNSARRLAGSPATPTTPCRLP